jgi:hypothetical protein
MTLSHDRHMGHGVATHPWSVFIGGLLGLFVLPDASFMTGMAQVLAMHPDPVWASAIGVSRSYVMPLILFTLRGLAVLEVAISTRLRYRTLSSLQHKG